MSFETHFNIIVLPVPVSEVDSPLKLCKRFVAVPCMLYVLPSQPSLPPYQI